MIETKCLITLAYILYFGLIAMTVIAIALLTILTFILGKSKNQ